MDCTTVYKTILDTLTFSVALGGLAAACVAGRCAWLAYKSQEEQLRLAKRGVDFERIRNSPHFVAIGFDNIQAFTETVSFLGGIRTTSEIFIVEGWKEAARRWLAVINTKDNNRDTYLKIQTLSGKLLIVERGHIGENAAQPVFISLPRDWQPNTVCDLLLSFITVNHDEDTHTYRLNTISTPWRFTRIDPESNFDGAFIPLNHINN